MTFCKRRMSLSLSPLLSINQGMLRFIGKAKVTIASGFDNISEEGSYEFANMKAASNAETEFAHQQAPPSIQDAVLYHIRLDQFLPLSSFPLSMVLIRPSSTQSLKQW